MKTQTAEYWTTSAFQLTEEDIEQIYNFLLSEEEPQTIQRLALEVIEYRLNNEINQLQRRLQGRTVYQPSKSYEIGDALVFPHLQFIQGEVTGVRDATNPQIGDFAAIEVQTDTGESREFAANLTISHPLNDVNTDDVISQELLNGDELLDRYGSNILKTMTDQLNANPEFIRLGRDWFIESLLADVNTGHLHLSEAVLDMHEGGPLPTPEIVVHLDMDSKIPASVQEFSLNYALVNDDRFDEVAPPGRVSWFLRRSEPPAVQEAPESLAYDPISFDRALLGTSLLQMERELDDEWSDLSSTGAVQPIKFTLSYPHFVSGTLPLSSRIKPLFPMGITPRQIMTMIDDETGEEINCWVVADGRYVFGLREWYEKNELMAGAYINLTPTEEVGRVKIGLDRRPRPRKEYIRVARIDDGQLSIDIEQHTIGFDYDDLMIVMVEAPAAIDVLGKQLSRQSLVSLIATIFPDLAKENGQNSAHAKTIYGAVNLLTRVAPGVVFAELVRNAAFISVGDQYWQFDRNKWQG